MHMILVSIQFRERSNVVCTTQELGFGTAAILKIMNKLFSIHKIFFKYYLYDCLQ